MPDSINNIFASLITDGNVGSFTNFFDFGSGVTDKYAEELLDDIIVVREEHTYIAIILNEIGNCNVAAKKCHFCVMVGDQEVIVKSFSSLLLEVIESFCVVALKYPNNFAEYLDKMTAIKIIIVTQFSNKAIQVVKKIPLKISQ